MKNFRCILGALLLVFSSTHAYANSKDKLDNRADAILAKMSLEEKIGQMVLRDWSWYKDSAGQQKIIEAVKAGKIGGFLNVPRHPEKPDAFIELQKAAVENSQQGIPLIFGHDVIHGYKTIFPIPLGQAASWNPEIVKAGARVAAEEASSMGIRWTFAPMLDISRDPRWGRIAESLGEDTYLSSVLGAAMVKGFQGDYLADPSSLASCPKHFIGYGAAEGGKDYNTAYIPDGLLRDVYLPPFQAAIEAGAPTIMSSYNELNGVPATGNKRVIKGILKDEWGFEGFVVSDFWSVLEMTRHGYARDEKRAAELAVNAGIDFEMESYFFENNIAQLIKEKKLSEAQIDDAVKRLLKVKIQLGLFESPYPETERRKDILNSKFLEKSKQAAIESFVLLKNENSVLPLSPQKRVAVLGPLANAPWDQLGTWVYEGEEKDSRPLLPALKKLLGVNANFRYTNVLKYSRSKDTQHFGTAKILAQNSDVILFVGGEESILSGEGHSRGDISLPGVQEELIKELAKTGKPIVLVIMAGRPISLEGIVDKVDAIMMAWHPGTMAGPALADVLYGKTSPSGRLPITWPKSSGQIPVYYNHKNTGRPPETEGYTLIDDISPDVRWQHEPGNSTNHLDYGHLPEFPFGFGLTYSSFKYDKVKINKKKIKLGESVKVSARIKNMGKVTASEVVQLYVRDLVGDVTRPVKELKGFERITLKPGQSKTVDFKIHTDDLAFHNQDMKLVTEPGDFKVWVAKSSADNSHELEFEIIK